jgi:monofunctional biosynthetic peptidoglycan transglycosylase
MPQLVDRRGRSHRSWRRRLARRLAIALFALLLLPALPTACLRFVPPPTSAFMLRHAARSAFGNAPPVRYDWVGWPKIAKTAAIAAVAAEDQKFPHHAGFDLASIDDALDDHGRKKPLRGASTISQQVAKNLFLWPGRSFLRKGLEAYLTLWLEALWPKRRILEVYLNVAEFGDGVFGVEAASRTFFDKPASRLAAREAALLAAVLPNPRKLHADRPSAYVRRRAAWIDRQVRALGGPGYLARLR